MQQLYSTALYSLKVAQSKGDLDHVEYDQHDVFGIAIPRTCAGVPAEILNPRNTWVNGDEYDLKANFLAEAFNKNFEQYAALANNDREPRWSRDLFGALDANSDDLPTNTNAV